MIKQVILALVIGFMVLNGTIDYVANSACKSDVSFRVEQTYTVISENCDIIGYVVDNSYPRFTDDNGRIFVNFNGDMLEIVEVMQASENGHLYSTVDFGNLHDMAIPISTYTQHYFKGQG